MEQYSLDWRTIWHWLANKQKYQEARNKRNSGVRQVHPGREGILTYHGVADDLKRYIFEMREQAMPVTVPMVVKKACTLYPPLRHKSKAAQTSIIWRFIKSNGFTYRSVTQKSLISSKELENTAINFVQRIREVCLDANPTRHPDYILNMDQTPVWSMTIPKSVIDSVGNKSVKIKTTPGTKKRFTVAVTVTASGKKLPEVVVFKGKPGKRIAWEVENFQVQYGINGIYAVQENAWMDEAVMCLWVQEVLQPYLAKAPPNVHPLILLDSYWCHMMVPIVQAIEALGCQVEHIPPGCTPLCQPIDIGVCKPLKDWMREF